MTLELATAIALAVFLVLLGMLLVQRVYLAGKPLPELPKNPIGF
jgi:hypothetical protein